MTICQSFTLILLNVSLPFWQADFFLGMSEFIRTFASRKEGGKDVRHPFQAP